MTTCQACGVAYPEKEFYDARRRLGLRPTCRRCVLSKPVRPPRPPTDYAHTWRRRRGQIAQNTRLHACDVRDIRRWARREGWGYAPYEQARLLQRWYPVAIETLVDVVQNQSWRDPDYDPAEPDPVWHAASPALLLLLMVRRVCALMHASTESSVKIGVQNQVELPQGRDGVLD